MNRIKKIIGWLLGILSLLILVLAVFINFFENKIQSKIISVANENLRGELVINKLNYTIFSTYPDVIIGIEGLQLFEEKLPSLQSFPILNIGYINLSLNLRALIDGNYLINAIALGDAEIAIINYEDSTLNINNALVESEAVEDGKPLSLTINSIELDNVKINYEDQVSDRSIFSNLYSLKSKFQLKENVILGNVNLAYHLDSITHKGKRLIKSHHLTLKSKLESDLENQSVIISDGEIKLDLLEAGINGSYSHLDSGYVDIAISANHSDISELTKLELLNATYLPDIRNGEIMIDASIIGKTAGKLPIINATASLKKLTLYNTFGKVIEEAGFSLEFNSGNEVDFKEASLKVDSISCVFSAGGYINGSLKVNNFETPNFSIHWEAFENLENLYRIIEIPEIKSMKGALNTSGSISGIFNLKNKKLLHHSGAANIDFKHVGLVLNQSGYSIANLNGTVYLANDDAGFDGISLEANSNKIELNGRVNNLMPFMLGNPAQLSASISVKADKINTESLLAFDEELAANTRYSIDELDVSIAADLNSKALADYKLIPSGKLEIHKLTLLMDGAPPLVGFNGSIEVDEKLVAIKELKGIIGKSQVDFSVSVSNYSDYLQNETTEQMVVDVALKSEKVNAKDFFTINNKFVLPKNYEEEVLKNVAINAKIITTNIELQKKDLIPEFELQLTGMQFQTLHSPVVFKDIFVFGLVKDNSVFINSLFGKFGRSDVFMNAQFDNVVATKDTISRELKSRISFNAGVLDLNELIKLDEEPVEETEKVGEAEPTNPFAAKFPVTDFQVNIGELTYFDAIFRNLKGIIKIKQDNKIEMQQVSVESGEFGSFEFDGTLDASSRKEAILKSTIKISNVDLSNLNVKYVQNGEEVRISDHFQGMINGNIIADVPILPDFSFDLARLTGKVKVKMVDGALINYAPLEELGKYFKNKDLNFIKFDELKNTMIFNRGKMLLPFMTINTTLGTINLMGFQTMDYDMSYDIQVPIKLVAGSALNSLFFSKKRDDGKEDKVKKGGKGKYITVHISGSADEYNFKLGKKHVLTAPPGFTVD